MEKQYIYDDRDGRYRRAPVQCATDILALQFFDYLYSVDIDTLPEDNKMKKFYSPDGKFDKDTYLSDSLHTSLVKIKKNWANIKDTKTARAIHEFILVAKSTIQNLTKFTEYYSSAENHLFLAAERVLGGLASINEGNRFTIYEKQFHFDDNEAAEQFRYFMQVQKSHYLPQEYS